MVFSLSYLLFIGLAVFTIALIVVMVIVLNQNKSK